MGKKAEILPLRSRERRHNLYPREGKGTNASVSPWGTTPGRRDCSEITPQLLLHLRKANTAPSAGADPNSVPANILPPREELPLQHRHGRNPTASDAGHQHRYISPFVFSSVHDARVDLHNLLKGRREMSRCTTFTQIIIRPTRPAQKRVASHRSSRAAGETQTCQETKRVATSPQLHRRV